MKKLKTFIVGGICAVMLSVGIGCCVGLLRDNKAYAQATQVSDFAELSNAISSDAGHIVILKDIAFSSTINVGKNVKISSNGNFSLKRAAGFDGTLFSIQSGASFELSSQEGTSVSLDGENLVGTASAISSVGTFTFGKNAIIKNFKADSIKGVSIYNNGTLNVAGGEILDNELTGKSGNGIIYNDQNSRLNISAGKVSNNISTQTGTIYVHNGSVVNMSGGEISNNKITSSSKNAGGIYLKEVVAHFTGGKICGNSAYDGGGIHCTDSAVITLDGIEISDNKASHNGGGICLKKNAQITFKSGKITGNSVDASTGSSISGGGLYLGDNAEFIMEGGEISSNTAKHYGGAAYLRNNSTFTLKNGTISLNSANSSGGAFFLNTNSSVCIEDGLIKENKSGNGGAFTSKKVGELKVLGGIFTANTSTKMGGAVYVYDAGKLTVHGGTFSNNGTIGKDIYVTAGRTATFLGGSFVEVKNSAGIVEIGGAIEVSEGIKMLTAVTEGAGFIRVLSEIENPIVVEAFDYTVETKETLNTLFRVVENPYINVYNVLDKISFTNATKTLQYEGNKVLLVDMANRIDVLADERVITAPKTAKDGQAVEFDVLEEYKISNLSIVDDSDNPISFTTTATGYSFIMPTASGVKIDYDYVKSNLSIIVDSEIEEFVDVSSTAQFKDIVKISLKKVRGKKLETLKVGNGTWSQDIDLRGPEFKMFKGATLSGTIFDYSTILDTIPGNVVQVFTESELRTALNTDGTIIAIMDDITLSNAIKLNEGTYTIFSINRSSILRGESCKAHMFEIGWKTTLNLGMESVVESDLFIDGCNESDTVGSLIFLEDGGIVNMYNGVTLRNNKLNTVNIAYSSEKKGNGSAGGAGVYNYNGIFNMYGGSIESNFTKYNGAGVYNYGKFNLYGGNIQNNKCLNSGAGVYNYRVFYQDGGNILNNACIGGGYGGGLYNASQLYAYYYLVSGKVSGNSSITNGGGIFASSKGVVWIKGGEISGNTTEANGGGISSKGTLNIVDGLIKDNFAKKNGGGVYSYADDAVETFNFIRGGTIESNTAAGFGGGIYMYSSNEKIPYMEISDVKISGNVSPNGEQVYIVDGVVEIGTGVQIVGKLSTGKEPSKNSGFLKFVGQLDFELEIDPFKYVDYEVEEFNVLVVDESVDAMALAEKIKLSDSGYFVKVVDNNLYICPVA